MTNDSTTYRYLDTEALAERIQYDPRTIRNSLKDTVFTKGRHYLRPFGRRKILWIWDHIEADFFQLAPEPKPTGPRSAPRHG